MALVKAQYKATERPRELVDDLIDGCLATQPVKGSLSLVMELLCLLRPHATTSVNTVCATATKR